MVSIILESKNWRVIVHEAADESRPVDRVAVKRSRVALFAQLESKSQRSSDLQRVEQSRGFLSLEHRCSRCSIDPLVQHGNNCLRLALPSANTAARGVLTRGLNRASLTVLFALEPRVDLIYLATMRIVLDEVQKSHDFIAHVVTLRRLLEGGGGDAQIRSEWEI